MKRIFDIIFAILLILLLFFPMILFAVIIKIDSIGPVIHYSRRIGRYNKIFVMLKFRTMKINAPQVSTDKLKSSSKYITSVGKFLRKSSLDELPQLFNIIYGSMSFVGPRPGLFNQISLKVNRTKLGIHQLTPGITGLAQINGRDLIKDKKKIQYDLEYLNERNFFYDIKIIFKTIIYAFIKKDISH